MFGYVILNPQTLSPDRLAVYRGYYCGLCRTLKHRYGVPAQAALSYDMTFLALLLSALYEAQPAHSTGRCPMHPMHTRPRDITPFTEYAADMSVILTYYNLLDDWNDTHNSAAKAGANALKKYCSKASALHPRQASAIRSALSMLDRCEKIHHPDLDAVAGCFGALLADVLDFKGDEWSGPLRELGMNLGKFIYLMDAYEDLDKDRKACRYNPLQQMANQPDYEARIHDILEYLMAGASAAFERLPILQDADLLRSILYSGVWTRYEAIQKRRKGETT